MIEENNTHSHTVNFVEFYVKYFTLQYHKPPQPVGVSSDVHVPVFIQEDVLSPQIFSLSIGIHCTDDLRCMVENSLKLEWRALLFVCVWTLVLLQLLHSQGDLRYSLILPYLDKIK